MELFISKFHCAGKRLLQNLILFFLGKFHFELWFSIKNLATKSCLLKWARKVRILLFSAEQIESKQFFSDMKFSSESCFSKKIELKIYFSEINFSPQNEYSKSFVLEICGNEKFSIQNVTIWSFFISKFHCVGKRLLQNLILFFGKLHFKLCFSMKNFATKSCLLKWARIVNNLLFCAEQIESKRYFLDVMFLSKSDSSMKIEFKIYFSENIFSPQKEYSKSFVFKICRDEKLSKHNLKFWENVISKSLFVGKVCFRIWFLFPKKFIWNSDFHWKSLRQKHAF